MPAVEARPDEIEVQDGVRIWDVTAAVRSALAPGPRRLFFVLGAESCHGCQVLSRQLAEHGAALGDGTAIVEGKGGDFSRGDHATGIRIGHATISGPGVPLGVLFDVTSPEKLTLAAVAVGPMEERAPARGFAGLAEGRSAWVPEADGVALKACVGGLCFVLDRTNGFSAPLSILLPA